MRYALLSTLMFVVAFSANAQTQPAPIVREERHVLVEGKDEIWQLQWEAAPHAICTPDQGDDWWTCPCWGFAYGETGPLRLVRFRDGKEYEHLVLTPFFDGESPPGAAGAFLQRWAPGDSDYKNKPSMRMIAQRSVVTLMNFQDYDHDGNATEFFLPTQTSPCGHTAGFVVGISENNSHLHVFGSAQSPDEPLILSPGEWQALAKGIPSAVNVLCGDHGSETETDLELHASKAGIIVTPHVFSCNANGERGAPHPDGDN